MSTILVSGAGRGLGLELARQYTQDGWRVIGTVRDAAARKRLEKLGAQAHIVDLTRLEHVETLAKQLNDEALDVLFCSAGIIGKRGMTLGKFDYASWDEVLRVNLLGAAALAEALVDNVTASERKLIAMMSSRLGSITESSGMTLPYATSKAAVNMLVKGLAATLAPKGVICVALGPGWVRTDMGGASAPLAPETSVAGLRKVLARLKAEDSGRFFSHDGSSIPW